MKIEAADTTNLFFTFRSQKDIEGRKDIKIAVEAERKFFLRLFFFKLNKNILFHGEKSNFLIYIATPPTDTWLIAWAHHIYKKF